MNGDEECRQKQCVWSEKLQEFGMNQSRKSAKVKELLKLRSSLLQAVEFHHCTKQIKATVLHSFHSRVQCV